jgi:hypothetical protein
MFKNIENYVHWEKSQEKIDIIRNIEIVLKAKRCIEPEHPKFPKFILA